MTKRDLPAMAAAMAVMLLIGLVARRPEEPRPNGPEPAIDGEAQHYYAHRDDEGRLHYHSSSRSTQWPAAARAYKKDHPNCEYCGKAPTADDPNEVHHKEPFHKHPELELDPKNFRTLCRPHHFSEGHLGDWHSWNPALDEDVARHRKEVEGRPR